MKIAQALPLLLLISSVTVLANAQSPKPQHIIVVIQENRSPDNLFQDQNLINNGADIWDVTKPFACKYSPYSVPVYAGPLKACFDPNHAHHPSWVNTYDGGKMDGACGIYINKPENCTPPSATPAVTYVENEVVTPGTYGLLDPYFQIAETYGFANYMFQTNQGPSFPAHQFLFSGTSAPVYPGAYYDWFAAENPGQSYAQVGCTAPSDETVLEIDPNGDPEELGYTPPYNGIGAGYPCYSHYSMADVLDNANPPITWTYYAPPSDASTGPGLWTAPDALSAICPFSPNGACDSDVWNGHVVVSGTERSILTDIQDCNLPAVSWVIPDGLWSDHAGSDAGDGGPSWVAAIVNAVGVSPTACDSGYWSNTVILIIWDDWGGFYDHVVPPDCQTGTCTGYGGANGGGAQYVYGFRVPLLVVSAYANQHYVSGACGITGYPNCPNEQQPYIHDFGSILAYIEYVFGTGEINPSYHYADYYAPDGPNNPQCGQSCTPLADFFGSTYYPFTQIQHAKYPPTCFTQDPNSSSCFGSGYPSDPDDDEIDLQD